MSGEFYTVGVVSRIEAGLSIERDGILPSVVRARSCPGPRLPPVWPVVPAAVMRTPGRYTETRAP